MKFLFIHQNFPGQYEHLAPALARAGHEVVALSMRRQTVQIPGVRILHHYPKAPPAEQIAGLSAPDRDMHAKIISGRSAARAIQGLTGKGFRPDLVIAHPGWGEAYFIKDVLPHTPLLTYAEFYYRAEGADAGFDPEFLAEDAAAAALRIRIKNTHLLHAINAADCAISPTRFQRDCHPEWARQKIRLIHDGIDTGRFRPDPDASVTLKAAGCTLRPGDETVTFIARSLEPYRGYHQFLRALPELLARRPAARVVIVGEAGTSYGTPPPPGRTWREIFWDEVKGQVDRRRVHFVGRVSHDLLTQLLQVSAAHVYLTYPFVLSWSMLEAMSIGCLIIGSRTAPVEEVIRHRQNGLLVDFFNPRELAGTLAEVLARPDDYRQLRAAARNTIVDGFDLHRACLPAQVELACQLAS